jgi:SpoVK/Ycf46/Vps4 family AAA+-type ATPase
VDFRALAERHALSGGDIKNAVLKAASAAAGETGNDRSKRIHQRHFERAIDDVIEAKSVMQQSLFTSAPSHHDPAVEALRAFESRWRGIIVGALALAGASLIAAVASLIVALAR